MHLNKIQTTISPYQIHGVPCCPVRRVNHSPANHKHAVAGREYTTQQDGTAEQEQARSTHDVCGRRSARGRAQMTQIAHPLLAALSAFDRFRQDMPK